MCFAGGQIYKNKLLSSFLWIFDLVQSKGGLWGCSCVVNSAGACTVLLSRTWKCARSFSSACWHWLKCQARDGKCQKHIMFLPDDGRWMITRLCSSFIVSKAVKGTRWAFTYQLLLSWFGDADVPTPGFCLQAQLARFMSPTCKRAIQSRCWLVTEPRKCYIEHVVYLYTHIIQNRMIMLQARS